MKKESYAEMAGRCFGRYVLGDEKIAALHKVLLVMLDDIDVICRQNGLKYMLSGGSCLGAVRHSGFIPWDDDADIMMYSSDALKLAELLLQKYDDKYSVSLPLENVGAGRMMKIYLSETKYIEIGKENYPCEKKVFVDVFPIIKMPPEAKRKAVAKKHKVAARMYSYGLMSKFPSPVIKDAVRVDKSLKNYYNKRKAIGFFAALPGLDLWLNKLRSYEKDYVGVSDSEGIPSGIDYEREVFPSGFFEKVVEADFEGRKYFIPENYREYLTNLYKDYMTLPPPEKRERHYASEAYFGKYAGEEQKIND